MIFSKEAVKFIKLAKHKNIDAIEDMIERGYLQEDIVYPDSYYPRSDVSLKIQQFNADFFTFSGIGNFSPDLFLAYFNRDDLIIKRNKSKSQVVYEKERQEVKRDLIHFLSFSQDNVNLFEHFHKIYESENENFSFVFLNYLNKCIDADRTVIYPKNIINKMIDYVDIIPFSQFSFDKNPYLKSYNSISCLVKDKSILLTIINNKDFETLTKLNDSFKNMIGKMPKKHKDKEIKNLEKTDMLYSCFRHLVFKGKLEKALKLKKWCDQNVKLNKPLLVDFFEKSDWALVAPGFLDLMKNAEFKKSFLNFNSIRGIKAGGRADKVLFLKNDGCLLNIINAKNSIKKILSDLEFINENKIMFIKSLIDCFPDLLVEFEKELKINSQLIEVKNQMSLTTDNKKLYNTIDYCIKKLESDILIENYSNTKKTIKRKFL